ncbi:MAG: hypothetical protein DWQ37_20310 [Planctomycetota bacterium]|nr:MAG: hypothetical protein DWQ37_20310 [Planctomycetota bacterium]
MEIADVDRDYYARYKDQHGVDLARLVAERTEKIAATLKERAHNQKTLSPCDAANVAVPANGSMDNLPQLPPNDQDLYCQVILSRMRDKEGFYVAATNILLSTENRPDLIGELEHLTVEGKTARGMAFETMRVLVGDGQGQQPVVPQTIRKPYRFRLTNGSWLMEVVK